MDPGRTATRPGSQARGGAVGQERDTVSGEKMRPCLLLLFFFSLDSDRGMKERKDVRAKHI